MKLQNSVDFTVGVAPKTTSIEQDMLFVKSALLYADTVTLISPMASTYFQLTNEADRKNERTLYSLISKVFSFCLSVDPIACANMQPTLEQFGAALHSKSWKSAPMVLRLQTSAAMKKFGQEVSEVVTRMLGENNCGELIGLVKSGKVKLYNFQRSLADDVDDYVNEFFEVLARSVNDMQTFPLFDDQSNDLIRTAVNANVITLNGTNEFNVKHAGVANNLLVSLPSFEFATTNEILDIRKELDAPLVRFRSKLLSYNGDIQSMPWDDEFEAECFRLYQKDVAPSILEIDELTKDSGFVKNLGYSILSDNSALKAAGGLVISIAAAGAVSAFTEVISSDIAMLATGGAYAASKIANAYKEYKDRQKEVTRKDMYFYYKAGKLLAEKYST